VTRVISAIDPTGLLSDSGWPPLTGATRATTVEVVSQCLGSGLLAGTMRAPLGTAILVGFMGQHGVAHAAEPMLLLLLLTNLIAVAVNRLSPLGQVDKGWR